MSWARAPWATSWARTSPQTPDTLRYSQYSESLWAWSWALNTITSVKKAGFQSLKEALSSIEYRLFLSVTDWRKTIEELKTITNAPTQGYCHQKILAIKSSGQAYIWVRRSVTRTHQYYCSHLKTLEIFSITWRSHKCCMIAYWAENPPSIQ